MLTPYSAAISAKTAAEPAIAVPSGLKSAAQTDTSVSLSWVKSANVPRYRVQRYTKADMSDSVFYRFTESEVEIKGLEKGTVYQFRVRGITDDGSVLTPYSAAISAKTAAEPAIAVPSGLTAAVATPTSVAVSWKAVANAPEYRVQVYSKSDMSDSVYKRFPATSGKIYNLLPETTYYARVRVISSAGESLTPYSAPVKVTLPVDPFPTPTGLAAAPTHRTMNVTWAAVPNAPQYRLAVATKADMSDAVWYRYTTNSAEIRGLKASSTYFFQVRVIKTDGSLLSAYGPVLTATTQSEPPPPPPLSNPLTVGSFNVMCAQCTPDDTYNPNALPWNDRRPFVVDTITKKMPDILGVQEASQGRLDDVLLKGGLSQFEDLKQRLNASGAPYELTNDKRYNCENPATPTACVYADQGASQGTRIFYNPTTVEILKSGSRALPMMTSEENARYFSWAIAKQRSTGKIFFFGNTHLSANKADGYGDIRRRQAEVVVEAIRQENAAGYPVVMAGDLNSSKWIEPSNAPYDVMTRSGLVDPLGNDYWQQYPSMAATAEKRINAHLNSWNGFESISRAAGDPAANGTYIDYIFTSKMRVSEWETVATLDANGNYAGTIPSDHNMLVAKVGLP
ncbi:fibronectin type III domain-containing protein [Arthrobacter sp. CP30]